MSRELSRAEGRAGVVYVPGEGKYKGEELREDRLLEP